jgi:hypothetical protein
VLEVTLAVVSKKYQVGGGGIFCPLRKGGSFLHAVVVIGSSFWEGGSIGCLLIVICCFLNVCTERGGCRGWQFELRHLVVPQGYGGRLYPTSLTWAR